MWDSSLEQGWDSKPALWNTLDVKTSFPSSPFNKDPKNPGSPAPPGLAPFQIPTAHQSIRVKCKRRLGAHRRTRKKHNPSPGVQPSSPPGTVWNLIYYPSRLRLHHKPTDTAYLTLPPDGPPADFGPGPAVPWRHFQRAGCRRCARSCPARCPAKATRQVPAYHRSVQLSHRTLSFWFLSGRAIRNITELTL